jgi:DNA invertase Pin-like site-specific DNA recombinase
MKVGYARVSSKEQVLDQQIDTLAGQGVDERNIYQERGTGTKMDRPELNRMISGPKIRRLGDCGRINAP